MRGVERHADAAVLAPFDLAQTDNVGALADRIWQESGGVDVVVHSGGISQRSLLIHTAPGVDRQMMEVNYFGTLALTRALLPHMIAAGGGHFAVVTSLMGLFSAPLRSGYAGAKHAMHGWFEALAGPNTSAMATSASPWWRRGSSDRDFHKRPDRRRQPARLHGRRHRQWPLRRAQCAAVPSCAAIDRNKALVTPGKKGSPRVLAQPLCPRPAAPRRPPRQSHLTRTPSAGHTYSRPATSSTFVAFFSVRSTMKMAQMPDAKRVGPESLEDAGGRGEEGHITAS